MRGPEFESGWNKTMVVGGRYVEIAERHTAVPRPGSGKKAMDAVYSWRVSVPGDDLPVAISLGGDGLFRVPLSDAGHPSVQAAATAYAQARLGVGDRVYRTRFGSVTAVEIPVEGDVCEGVVPFLRFDDGHTLSALRGVEAARAELKRLGSPEKKITRNSEGGLACLRDPQGKPVVVSGFLNAAFGAIEFAPGARSEDLEGHLAIALAVVGARAALGGDIAEPVTDGAHDVAGVGFNSQAVCHVRGGVLANDKGPAIRPVRGGRGPRVWVEDGCASRAESNDQVSHYRIGLLNDLGEEPGFRNGAFRAHFRNGMPHREGGPQKYRTDSVDFEYRVNGQLHRLDGPAESRNEGAELSYYVNGGLHREGGLPAVERKSGRNEFWENGVRVNYGEIERWHEMASLFFFALVYDPNTKDRRQGERTSFTMNLKALRTLLDKVGVVNFGDEALDLLRKTKWSKERLPRDFAEPARLSGPWREGFLAIRLAGLVACGKAADIPHAVRAELAGQLSSLPSDAFPSLTAFDGKPMAPKECRLWLDSLLHSEHPEPTLPASSTADKSVVVEFAYPWIRPGRTGDVAVRSLGQARLDVVDPDAAPAVAGLRTLDGETIDLRMLDGEYFRPVLSPGCARPISVGEFAKSAAGDLPWRDAPFFARQAHDATALAIGDACPLARDLSGDEEQRRRSAYESAIVQARRLVVVDGVVYRKTDKPHLAITSGASFPKGGVVRRLRVEWRLGDDLRQTDRQSVFLLPDSERHLGREPVGVWRDGIARAADGLRFPLAAQNQAREAVRVYCQTDTARGEIAPEIDSRDAWEFVAPPLDLDDPLPVLDHMAKLLADPDFAPFGSGGATWLARVKGGLAGARDAVSSGDADALRGAAGAFSAILDGADLTQLKLEGWGSEYLFHALMTAEAAHLAELADRASGDDADLDAFAP